LRNKEKEKDWGEEEVVGVGEGGSMVGFKSS